MSAIKTGINKKQEKNVIENTTSLNLKSRKFIIVYSILVACFIGIVFYLCWLCVSGLLKINQEESTIELQAINVSPYRKNCETLPTYCFDDDDCTTQCAMTTNFTCSSGICTNRSLLEFSTLNECDPALGFIAYYIGDVAFGDYNFICKSADPGIAINNNGVLENNMCKNGSISIDYLSKYPSMTECTCNNTTLSNQIVIPATEEVREYIVCVSDNIYKKINGVGLSS